MIKLFRHRNVNFVDILWNILANLTRKTRSYVLLKASNLNLLRPFIHGGKDQHGEPLLCPCLELHAIFLVIFLDWVMLPHPQATSTDHVGPRTSDLSIEMRRRNYLTTHFTKLWFFGGICNLSVSAAMR